MINENIGRKIHYVAADLHSVDPVSRINNESVGICIGASTVTGVHLEITLGGYMIIKSIKRLSADGSPKTALLNILKYFPKYQQKIPIVITGRKLKNRLNFTSISESEATEIALQLYRDDKFDAVASLGAETFVVYKLNQQGEIRKLISKNQCASGTGEFFMQQIGRMDLSVNDAVTISSGSEPFIVSGRCSVFCKSDCTHALNKGVPKENVTAGLALMIAGKAEELLKTIKPRKFLIVGGVTQNNTVLDFLAKKFCNIVIPNEALYFEALGAAIYGLQNEVTLYDEKMEVFSNKESQFTFHKPLALYSSLVTFRSEDEILAKEGDECILGLDVGSTTTKAVLIRTIDDKIIASSYLYTNGNPVKASVQVYADIKSQLIKPVKIIGLGTTGSGRHITALHSGSHSVINEISAHAKASVYFDPEVDTIFEIGGQDAKYTLINNKVPTDYAMNEACSAGTGSFIQEAAWESLKIDLKEIEPIAMNARHPLNFRDQCAALIGSDIKSASQENYSQEDIVAGLVYSICLNYTNRVKGQRPIGRKIFMQGGVCYNKAIPVAMAAVTGKPVIVPPLPGLMGAFGTALMVKEKILSDEIKKQVFDLEDLINRKFSKCKSFICKDKHSGCDRKCEINTFNINGKHFAFGGACNKYYDNFTTTEKDLKKNDYISKRMDLIFGVDSIPYEPLKKQITVGLTKSFTINRLYPLYRTFFSELRFDVVMPEQVDSEGFDNQFSSFCYPAELAHGFFRRLIDMQPDYIFMPELYEMHVPGCENDEKDSSATCVFISKEINYLSQAFEYDKQRIIHPYLNFAKGYLSQEKVFISVAQQLGIRSKLKAIRAYRKAIKAQTDVEERLLEVGTRAIDELSINSYETAIVIVGRDYNAFTDVANKGIPQKLASLGYKVIPYDILDLRAEDIAYYQSWEAGKKILKVAQIIKRNPQLFAVYISNFSCGPDSFLIPLFRAIMGEKPSLTLELDQHTADAGVNTRIDAFLDVVKNYRNSLKKNDNHNSSFKVARIINKNSIALFIDSKDHPLSILQNKVKIVIPCIGDMASALFAASLRSLGYNAVAMPEMDHQILETGHRFTSGKECLPIVLLTGSLLNYLHNNRLDGEPIAFFNIGGTSACRIAQYPGFLEKIIESEKIPNVAMFTLISQEGYLGLSTKFLKRSIEAIILNDVLEDVRSGVLSNAIDPEKGMEVFYEQFKYIENTFSDNYENIFSELKRFSKYISKNIPCRIPITESRYIALTGEIFIRHNQFAHKRLNYYLGKRGFILKDAYISEWIKYLDYAWRKGVDKPKFTFFESLSRLIREQYISYMEAKIQKILTGTGYLKPHKTRLVNVIRHSLHVLPLESTGEPALTLGTALSEGFEQFCGIINIGPFGCLQTRIAEAVCTPNMTLGHKWEIKKFLKIHYKIPHGLNEQTDIPFLTIECDGQGFPQIIESRIEAFLLQAERVSKHLSQQMYT
ncbi:MAG TPA: acyl-CoA dehydratase activase [Lentimicrobium sp.]|nr:acyl-CoA dehydratase activase [Lentimicrobium sp.]